MSLAAFEQNLSKHIKDFTGGRAEIPPPTAYAPTGKLKVTLKVRKKQLAADEFFSHTVDTISELQAELEAKKAARAAGWPIIAYVQDIQKV